MVPDINHTKRRIDKPGACPGGGPKGKLKSEKKVMKANYMLFHLYFIAFLVGNIIFSAIFCYFLSWAPLEKLKKQKKTNKKISDFRPPPPPLRIPGHATASHIIYLKTVLTATIIC